MTIITSTIDFLGRGSPFCQTSYFAERVVSISIYYPYNGEVNLAKKVSFSIISDNKQPAFKGELLHAAIVYQMSNKSS